MRSGSLSDAAERTAKQLEGFAILKHDGSIGQGFEIVTAPSTLELHRDNWKPFWSSTPQTTLSGWSSGKCGMHVHITRPSALTVGKMLCFLNADDNASLINAVAGRAQSSWAKVSPKKVTDWDKSSDRYEALNIQNRKTVEVRSSAPP